MIHVIQEEFTDVNSVWNIYIFVLYVSHVKMYKTLQNK